MNEINPFQTPAAEAAEPEPQSRGEFVPPRWRLVGACIVSVLAVSALAASLTGDLRSILEGPWAFALWYGSFFLLGGGSVGLGIALLIQAVRQHQFACLMPGHWRLIAHSFTFGGELSFSLALVHLLSIEGTALRDSSWVVYVLTNGVVAALPAGFYLWVLLKTQEIGWWRNFAQCCLIYYSLFIPYAVGIGMLCALGINDLIWPTFLTTAFITNLAGAAAVVPFFLGVAADSRETIRRDRYHEVGLVLPPIAQIAVWLVSGT